MKTSKKISLLLFTVFTTSLVAQIQTTSLASVDVSSVQLDKVNVNDEIIDDNAIQSYTGSFVIKNGNLVFIPDDCTLNKTGVLLKDLSGKKFKAKKWLKRVKKSPNKRLDFITIKGVSSSNHPVIFSKKVTKPLKKAKIWSSGTSSAYLIAAQELYQHTIELRNKYNYFSVSVNEVDDPTLGKITEYSLFDSKCKKLTPEEIKNLSDKDLDGLNNSIKIGGDLLLKQAALTLLATQSTSEIASASIFDKIPMGKDAATAGVFQAAIVAQLPKIVSNLKESKKYIEQLRAE